MVFTGLCVALRQGRPAGCVRADANCESVIMNDNNFHADRPPSNAGAPETPRVSIYASATDATSREAIRLLDWLEGIRDGRYHDVVDTVRREYRASGKSKAYQELKARKLPAVTPAGVFKRRNIQGITEPSGILPGDIDELSAGRLSQGIADLRQDPYVVYCFTSPSGAGIKLGVRIPPTTDDAVFKERFAGLNHYLRKKYGLPLDPSGKDISRLCFVSDDPECHISLSAETFTERRAAPTPAAAPINSDHVAQPVCIDDAALIEKMRSAANGSKFASLWSGDCSEYPSESEADLALCSILAFWTGKDAGRIDGLFRQSGLMRDKWDRDDYRQRTLAAAIATTHDVYNAHHESGGNAEAGSSDTVAPLSDVYNARRLVEEHGEFIRYIGAWKKIIVYRDGIWPIDHDGRVVEYAKAVARKMFKEATALKAAVKLEAAAIDLLSAPKEMAQDFADKRDAAEAYLKHAVKAHSAASIHNMIELAKSSYPLPVSHETLGTRHDLLPAVNCVVDLKTGAALPHSPHYLFTGLVPVAFDPHAVCPRWERFLLEVMGHTIGPDSPDDTEAFFARRKEVDARAHELVAYLKRVLGYCLTGLTKEQALFFFYGDGANGKSVLFEILLKLFGGDLGKKGTSNFLMVKKHDVHPTEQADLYRKRLVIVPETEKGARLSEVLVRELTGSDQITARHMNEDFWSFWPTHKFIIGTNHLPTFRDMSYAMRRRLQMVPFGVTFYDRDKPDDVPAHAQNNPHTAWADKDLTATLLNELPGILAWLVQGAVEWYALGIKPPSEVMAATQGYFDSQDVVQRFIDDSCYTGEGMQADITRLWETFKKWADDGNEPGKLTRTMFKETMEAKGYEQDRDKVRRYWKGIGLPSAAYDAPGDKTRGDDKTVTNRKSSFVTD
jgi:putative DNA primase/helicase